MGGLYHGKIRMAEKPIFLGGFTALRRPENYSFQNPVRGLLLLRP